MNLSAKRILKNTLVNIFHFGQRFGVDILPRHFYSEIPDIKKLKRTIKWREPYSLIGIAGADIEKQLGFCRRTLSHSSQLFEQSQNIYTSACTENGEQGFGPIEAEFFYDLILACQPAKIIQVGCGVSTAICIRAVREARLETKLVCIDPFPNEFLHKMSRDGAIELIEKPVEDIDPHIAESLANNDIFFVDSTHCLGPAGECSRLILEFLPRLNVGVIAHFHDIYFPFDYASDLLSTSLFFHHESALLHAFLTFNTRFRIELSFSMLHHLCFNELQELFPSYDLRKFDYGLLSKPGNFPSSTYLRVVSG